MVKGKRQSVTSNAPEKMTRRKCDYGPLEIRYVVSQHLMPVTVAFGIIGRNQERFLVHQASFSGVEIPLKLHLSHNKIITAHLSQYVILSFTIEDLRIKRIFTISCFASTQNCGLIAQSFLTTHARLALHHTL